MVLLKQFNVRDVILFSDSRSVKYFSSFTLDVCIVYNLFLAYMEIYVTELSLADFSRSSDPTEDLGLNEERF